MIMLTEPFLEGWGRKIQIHPAPALLSPEVEFPVEGCHADTENEDLSDGDATPIVIRTASAVSQYDSQPKENTFSCFASNSSQELLEIKEEQQA